MGSSRGRKEGRGIAHVPIVVDVDPGQPHEQLLRGRPCLFPDTVRAPTARRVRLFHIDGGVILHQFLEHVGGGVLGSFFGGGGGEKEEAGVSRFLGDYKERAK